MTEDFLIKLTNLSVRLADSNALKYLVRHSELELHNEKAVGLVGESGSGKTLTVSSILGIISFLPGITSGELQLNYDGNKANIWNDAPWRNHPEAKLEGLSDADFNRKEYFLWQRKIASRMKRYRGKKISIIFQRAKTSLNPFLTIKNQIYESLTIAGEAKDYDRMLEWLANCGFTLNEAKRIAGMYPHQLSGGQAQRAMMAVTLSSQATTIIADEPTTGLDAKLQVETLVFIKRMLDQHKRSAVIVSHNLYSVSKFTDVCYVMYRGLTVEKGPTSKILKPAGDNHPYTRKLREGVEKNRQIGRIVTGEITGCPFYPNCDLYKKMASSEQAKCREELPPKINIDSNHFIRCWAFDE
ncbi:MAG: ABC transporter ATP-binding protein [candidate division Zixibacteria bacterium]|nr:ABC transporter ATP-binding protein [candidate division Zixibacteria bacterium]